MKPMKITMFQFNQLMQTVADGWNEGNARKAADCFSPDAVYIEPPDKQVHRGRDELYEFFGGDNGPEIPMHMTWHHLAFNEEEQAGLRITVNDNGEGLPAEDLPFIFDRFWRKEKSRARLSGGTGLGLAITKQLVEAQGGTIEAKNLPESGLQVLVELKK